jgi:hypothetical protein
MHGNRCGVILKYGQVRRLQTELSQAALIPPTAFIHPAHLQNLALLALCDGPMYRENPRFIGGHQARPDQIDTGS